MKVFISHARADIGFADQLAAFLDDDGFGPVVDRHEAGQGRQARVETIISNVAAVVFVLTPASAGSETCAWEVAEAHRIGKRVVLVLPGPLAGLPKDVTDLNPIYFYSDPAVPNSGFFDGQRRLGAALRSDHEWSRTQRASRETLNLERRDARAARAQQRHEEKKQRRAEQRERAQRIVLARATQEPRMRGGFPFLRVTFLGIVAATVIGVVVNPNIADGLREALVAAADSVAPPPAPYSPMSVSAEDFTPDRALLAGRRGANVHNYPLTSATLVLEAPQGARFRVTGRLEVQGQWWFRVVLEDGRIGFVREDVVVWERPDNTPDNAPRTANLVSIEPAVEVTAGRAGAKVRTRPSRSASVIVRLPASATMRATGKLHHGAHWWLGVTLEDGRTGYVRDDVLTAASREALAL